MIWVTGDMHGETEAFKRENINKLKKGDSLIVCGDFGFIWDGSKNEQQKIKWIGKRKYNVLFIDGCHENYGLLENYPVQEWNGGKVRKISGNLMHLMRGELYNIDNKSVFAFGGGDYEETDITETNADNLKLVQPKPEDVKNGIDNLSAAGDKADIIITHDAPATIKGFINIEDNEQSLIHVVLEKFKERCDFKIWCFGKYHLDKMIPPRYRGVFQNVVKIED